MYYKWIIARVGRADEIPLQNSDWSDKNADWSDKNAELSTKYVVKTYKDNCHGLLIQRDHMFGQLNMVENIVNHLDMPLGQIFKIKENNNSEQLQYTTK